MSVVDLALAFPTVRLICRRTASAGERRLRDVQPLVIDDGCDVRLRRGDHADPVRVALLEWLPVARAELAVYENGRSADTTVLSVASLVRPPTIWSTGEAVAAARLLERECPIERGQFAWLVRHAHARLRSAHLARVRESVARIAGQLPVDGLSRASATVASGCVMIESDDDACASVATIQLARYSLSEVVARAAGALRLP